MEVRPVRDDEIQDLLRTLEDDRVPDPAFADDLHATLAGMSHRRTRRWPLVLLAAAAILALAGGAALGSGLIDPPVTAEATPALSPSMTPIATATPSPTASAATPSPTASSTDAQTPVPTPAPDLPRPVVTPPPDVLPVGSLVEVVVDALRVRSLPTMESDIVATVPRGEVLLLRDWSGPGLRIGPTATPDGFEWYAIVHLPGVREWPNDAEGQPPVIGFIASESGGQPFVELLEPRCPATVDVTSLTAITPWERLACFGNQQLTLEGSYGCGVCDALAWPGTFEPTWLASYLNPIFQVLSPVGRVQQSGVDPIALAFPPGVPVPAEEDRASIVRMTGHFNDSRAADCFIEVGQGTDVFTVSDTAAEWYCREQFVVDSWEVVGRDDAYPTPP
jgi:hypothetical protein